jgi:hypothetical protein
LGTDFKIDPKNQEGFIHAIFYAGGCRFGNCRGFFSILIKTNVFSPGGLALKNVDPELQELIEAEAYYASQVNGKLEEIRKCYDTFPEIKDEVESDLIELQEMYNSLKTDLNENISKKAVIEAMIENNRYRLKMVDQVLDQINC